MSLALLRANGLDRFVRYLLAGGTAAGANFLSRFVWSLALPFWAAVLAAYATGMVVAFALFRRFVFQGSPLPLGQQVRNFAVVNAVGAALATMTAVVLADWLLPALGVHHAQPLSHAIAVATPTLSSWILHQRLTFRQVA